MESVNQPPVDIFNDESTVPASDWFKFENPGDAVSGVLLEEPQYNVPGKFGPQNIYTLETAEGRVVMIGLNPKSHVRAVRQLKQAEVGDTVGIKFVDTYDSGKGNPGKNLDVRIRHANQVGAQEAVPFPSEPPKTPAKAPTAAPVVTGAITPAQKLAMIIVIAKAKLGATSDDDAKAKVMETTTMPLIESRYDEILNLLESLSKI